MYATQKTFNCLTKLYLPVPPMFEESVGYESSQTRFVAFYWTSAGDELMYMDDALTSGVIDYQGWLIFKRHPLVQICLQQYDFGGSDHEAHHWLLLDRHERSFYAGQKKAVAAFLNSRTHHPDQLCVYTSGTVRRQQQELEKKILELKSLDITPEIAIQKLSDRQAVCRRLKEWLG